MVLASSLGNDEVVQHALLHLLTIVEDVGSLLELAFVVGVVHAVLLRLHVHGRQVRSLFVNRGDARRIIEGEFLAMRRSHPRVEASLTLVHLDDAATAHQSAVSIRTRNTSVGEADTLLQSYELVVVVVTDEHAHHVLTLGERSKHATIDVSRTHLALVASAPSAFAVHQVLVFGQRDVEERQRRQRFAAVHRRVAFALVAVPGNLLEVNPVVVSQFVGLRIVVRVDAVEQRLHLVLLLGAIHRNDVLTVPWYAFWSVRTYEVSRLQKHVEYLLLAHKLRFGIMIAQRYCERHLRLLEYLYDSLPALLGRIGCDDIARQYSDVGLLLIKYSQDGVACSVASGRCWVPVDVGELHHLELAVLEVKLVLSECRSHNKQEEQCE